MFDDVNLYDRRDIVVITIRVPRKHPTTKIIMWQQRIFLKDAQSGLYYEESCYISPLITFPRAS